MSGMSSYRELTHAHTSDTAQFHLALDAEEDGDEEETSAQRGAPVEALGHTTINEGMTEGNGIEEALLPESSPRSAAAVAAALPYRRLGPSARGGLAACVGLGHSCARGWAAFNHWLVAPEREPTSSYVALIPLSDARLKPRRTNRDTDAVWFMLAVGVFFLVPRGVSVGRIEVHSEFMSWNKTLRTFQLDLKADLPIVNPNYLQTNVYGSLHVLFYDAETGVGAIKNEKVPARARPHLIKVDIDASHVPSNYTLTIMEHCLGTLEPRTLIFFLKGRLHASYLFQTQHFTEIDTYFMIDCILIKSPTQQARLPATHCTNCTALDGS
eukprot:CAMPEP_0177795568 /NCGR_PEP_ID=MMETSP0491_2-20121128/26311_1 /TAXON_ID=63592 /ORGANISM="Tetraselmis chuii, Strain PLY429" /LENGTH=325 /DNA_ID=CAMNT_0019318425 /DNA_START=306 /DNA_END=1284 /DNA_ORIENTATION=+